MQLLWTRFYCIGASIQARPKGARLERPPHPLEVKTFIYFFFGWGGGGGLSAEEEHLQMEERFFFLLYFAFRIPLPFPNSFVRG